MCLAEEDMKMWGVGVKKRESESYYNRIDNSTETGDELVYFSCRNSNISPKKEIH